MILPSEVLQEQLDMKGKPAGFELIQALESHGYLVVDKQLQETIYARVEELCDRLGVKV